MSSLMYYMITTFQNLKPRSLRAAPVGPNNEVAVEGWLATALERWLGAGLLTAAQAEAIRDFEDGAAARTEPEVEQTPPPAPPPAARATRRRAPPPAGPAFPAFLPAAAGPPSAT